MLLNTPIHRSDYVRYGKRTPSIEESVPDIAFGGTPVQRCRVVITCTDIVTRGDGLKALNYGFYRAGSDLAPDFRMQPDEEAGTADDGAKHQPQ